MRTPARLHDVLTERPCEHDTKTNITHVFDSSHKPNRFLQKYVYGNCNRGPDCRAAKGAVYVRVVKTEGGIKQAFNIIGTHTQAWNEPDDIKARYAQLEELKTKVGGSSSMEVHGRRSLRRTSPLLHTRPWRYENY